MKQQESQRPASAHQPPYEEHFDKHLPELLPQQHVPNAQYHK